MSERIWGLHSFIQQTFSGYLSCAVNFQGLLEKTKHTFQVTNNLKTITTEVKLKDLEVKPGYKKSQRKQVAGVT